VSSNGLRNGEQLREYRLGRYVDARDPLVMHEGHPLYRVESTAGWDLRPNSGTALPRRDLVQRPTASADDAVVAEVNKQRVATRAFTEQTAALNQKLGELGEAVGQTQEIAKQNIELKRDVAALRQQLNALDTQLRDRKPTGSSPFPSPEDKW
jgi:septal ring factor EnvC (AmiA/AmiB activator)